MMDGTTLCSSGSSGFGFRLSPAWQRPASD